MGIHHEPSSSPDEDHGSDPWSAEFSLFLASDPLRAQKIQLEASIALFCSELEDYGSTEPQAVMRILFPEPPHPVVEDLRAFFLPSFAEGEEHLSGQISSAGIIIHSAIAEQLSAEDELSSIATDALSAIVISEAVLCLGSFALSKAVYDCAERLEAALVEPFIGRIDDECERMGLLDVSEWLSPAVKRKTAEARYDLRLQEADAVKQTIVTRTEELTNLFEPLTQQAVQRLPSVVSPFFESYLTQPFFDSLTKYVRGNFEKSFSASVSDLLSEKIDAIDFALENLRDTMPS